MIRRLRNWAREIAWLAVVAVALFMVAVVFAVLSWGTLAVVLALIGVGLSVLNLRA